MDKTQILAKVKGFYESALQSGAYQNWREEAKLAWDFYDGTQWGTDEVAKLAEIGQPAIVINKIAARIDNIAGTEVAGRTRIAFRSRSGERGEEQAAQVLTDVMSFVAERADLGAEVSSAFRAGLVSGLGWLDVGVSEEGNGPEIFIRAEDELSVVYDPLCRTADLSDARFVARERWLEGESVKELFAEEGAAMLATLREEGGLPTGLGSTPWGQSEGVSYYDARREVYRVVEVQYKQTAKQWRVQQLNGQLQVFYDKTQARKAAQTPGAELQGAVWVPRVFVAYFAGGVLLSHQPLEGAMGQFTLIPYVYKRHKADGRPYGLVRGAIDPQRELNKRRSKAMHLLNTAQVIADIDAVDDPALLAREAARPDGMILKRAGKDLRIIRNSDLAASQVSVMEQAGRDIQDVLGVFDENLGKQSNATSGAAIQQRQLAGSLNQMFAFDGLRRMKKHLGMQLLALMRQTFTAATVLRITDNLGAVKQVQLNEGGVPDLNGVFDVVVEEASEALSARDMAVLQASRPDLLAG